jgi:CHAT domain-containing protein
LPFAALPGSKPNTYLVEEIALGVVPVPRLLAESPAAPVGDKPSLLLLGDVDYGASPGASKEVVLSRAAARGPGGKALGEWSSLKGTSEEIDALQGLFGKRFADGRLQMLRGGAATEEKFREQAPDCRWLHLATHGFFAPRELRSALAGDPAAGQAGADFDLFGRQGVGGFHPGLLCGLVLAGANRPVEPGQDDGILTASEVAVLDLGGVELAVLSACETGLGEVAGGEGVLGVQRAFQVSGARAVVASLWQVPDEPTRVLMERFYANLWDRKMTRLDALREAQLWMLKDGRKHEDVARGVKRRMEEDAPAPDGRLPPYYWAAFVLSGDWR